MDEAFERLLLNSIKQRPNKGLADYRLWKFCEENDGEGYGLQSAANPFYGRMQMSSDLVVLVAELCERRGLPTEVLDRIDYSSAGTAVALIYRLLDKSVSNPVAAILGEIDEIEADDAREAGFDVPAETHNAKHHV